MIDHFFKWWLPALVVLLSGCQPIPVRDSGAAVQIERSAQTQTQTQTHQIKLYTNPAGGEITVTETGQRAIHGETIEVVSGRYQLRAQHSGYRDGALVVDVGTAQSTAVTVPLGSGYARLLVSSTPPGATTKIDGEWVGATPLQLELDATEHQVALELDGFHQVVDSVSLLPGQQRRLSYQLATAQPMAVLEVTTSPPGALLRLDGRLIGHSPLTITDIPSGKHELVAELVEEDFTRLSASRKLVLEAGIRYPLELALSQRKAAWSEVVKSGEELPRGQQSGLSTAEVPAANFDTDSSMVLDNADSLVAAVELSPALSESLEDYWFVVTLNRWLRGGDGMELYRQGEFVGALHKSHGEGEAEMIEQLAQLGIRPRRQGSGISAVRFGQFKALLFSFYGLRGGYPLLNLTAAQTPAEQLKISRMERDGQVIILAADGEISVAGYEPDLVEAGLSRFRLPVGSEQLEVTWRPKVSGRLLVTAANSPGFDRVVSPATLGIGDKQVFHPVQSHRVDGVLQLSSGPDIRGWRQQRLRPLRMSGSVELKPMFEIGPHGRPGQYQRIWVVDYSIDNERGQRQLDLSYLVGSNQRSFINDQFLRRDGFSKTVQ